MKKNIHCFLHSAVTLLRELETQFYRINYITKVGGNYITKVGGELPR